MKIQKCHIPNVEEVYQNLLSNNNDALLDHKVWVSSTATRPNSCTALALRAHCAKCAPSAPSCCTATCDVYLKSHAGRLYIEGQGVSPTSPCPALQHRAAPCTMSHVHTCIMYSTRNATQGDRMLCARHQGACIGSTDRCTACRARRCVTASMYVHVQTNTHQHTQTHKHRQAPTGNHTEIPKRTKARMNISLDARSSIPIDP